LKRPSSQPPDLPGYEYIRLLGSGGFSDVFLYEQRLPRRRVAVKVLLTESLDAQTKKQFADEANLMASLSAHPYIVTIFHADVARDGRPYFVMEYCSGPSLAARYKAEPLGVEEALRVGVRLSSAVATAHAAGILHRDIKPANVLVNEYGAPALTDFGISSATEDDSIGLTTTSRELADGAATSGTSVGLSVPWSPPEMFGENPVPDVRSDIFSLAATIYTLLAGHTPFEKPGGSNTQLDLASRIQRGAMTPLARPDVPVSLKAILSKAMDPAPSGRYARATDFARALQGVEIELGYHATALEIPNSTLSRPEAAPDSKAEETRVRGVATIAAQPQNAPLAATAVASATREGESFASTLEATRIRPSQPADSTVIRTTGPTEPLAQSATPPTSPHRMGRVLGIVAISLLVVGGVLVILAVPRDSESEHPAGLPEQSDEDLPTSIVKPPVMEPAVRTADGTAVTFTWTNPDPASGDSYVWQRVGGKEDGPYVPTDASTATVSGVEVSEQVCIEVGVVRAPQTSEVSRECSPP
jgi:eukaryotic-like serine/threonine-protein kinase